MKSPGLTNQSVSRPELLHREKEVSATSLLIVNMTVCVACITFLTNGLHSMMSLIKKFHEIVPCGGRDIMRSVSLCGE